MPNFKSIGSGVSEPQMAENRYLSLTCDITLTTVTHYRATLWFEANVSAILAFSYSLQFTTVLLLYSYIHCAVTESWNKQTIWQYPNVAPQLINLWLTAIVSLFDRVIAKFKHCSCLCGSNSRTPAVQLLAWVLSIGIGCSRIKPTIGVSQIRHITVWTLPSGWSLVFIIYEHVFPLSARIYVSQYSSCCVKPIAVLHLTVGGCTSHIDYTYSYNDRWLARAVRE